MVEIMEGRHIEQAVDIHIASFPGFFLTRLGRPFLRLLYSAYVKVPDAIALVYVDEETQRVAGTSLGVARPAAFFRRQLVFHGLGYAIASVPLLLKEPRTIARLLRAAMKPSQVPREANSAEWSSMAVLPEFRRRGIAKKFTERMKEEARKRNATYLYGWTDQVDNDAINAHHRKAGADYVQQFTTVEGRRMNVIRYELN